ncbi:MAG TPA: hypothetical protein VH054_18940, partial [Polyangiaceae bacterium]|nr:hypothetical protein [Polyangiaceae bacterium]
MGLMTVLAIHFFGAAAHADGESPDDLKLAAKLFAEGQKAYREGDYRHAAEAFEGAYKRAPRLPPLYNAARAWQKGGEMVRAANLYAVYLRKAPPSAPDRNNATSALRDLEGRVAKLEVHASDLTDLKVDGAAFDVGDQSNASFIVYVTPGTHVIEGKHGDKTAEERPVATAGSSMSVVLVPAKDAAPVTVVVEDKPRSGWSPIVVAVGGGVTAVAAGFLVWSGVDTLSQRSTFDAAPTQANLDTGKSDQLRTNVLLGVTLGLAVVTGVVAIFLVDWKSHHAEKT